MRNLWLAGLIWWIFGAPLSAAAEFWGGTEAEVRQGTLARWSAWWTPDRGTEGRFWWQPEGGAAWLRLGEWQFGPLQETAASEGTVAWGPAVRQSGTWGAAWSGPVVGAWAVQKTDRFEAGLRSVWPAGPGSWGIGGGRTWNLDVGAGPRWSDRAWLGGSWAQKSWKGGTEFRTEREETGGIQSLLAGRVGVGEGAWDLEGRAQGQSSQVWTVRLKGRWAEPGWSVDAAWDRMEGWSGGASAQIRIGSGLWGLEADVRGTDGVWSGRTGASAAGPLDRGRWKIAWSLEPSPDRTQQNVEATWKQPGLEASADWTVEGLRLGWFGPGSRLTWKLRWEF